MAFEFTADKPIYVQLMEQIELRIISGEYRAGDKLPAVRDMATQASVNPNTMQKALAELERGGLLYTQRTSGRYITEDEAQIAKLKQTLAATRAHEFFKKLGALGYTQEQAIGLLHEIKSKEEERQ